MIFLFFIVSIFLHISFFSLVYKNVQVSPILKRILHTPPLFLALISLHFLYCWSSWKDILFSLSPTCHPKFISSFTLFWQQLLHWLYCVKIHGWTLVYGFNQCTKLMKLMALHPRPWMSKSFTVFFMPYLPLLNYIFLVARIHKVLGFSIIILRYLNIGLLNKEKMICREDIK